MEKESLPCPKLDEVVTKFLKTGVIEKSPSQDRRFLSKLFVAKEQTNNRPILDCTRLNQYIQYQHFKMEGIPALRKIIEPNDYMV